MQPPAHPIPGEQHQSLWLLYWNHIKNKSGKSLDQMKFETAFKIAYLRALIRAEKEQEKDQEIDENKQRE